jgi:hypothetical protein
MAIFTTKAYEFNPTATDILLNAFNRCGVRPTEITNSHLFQGQAAQNYILSEISNLQPNLWEVGLKAIPLAPGTATYSLPAETVQILDVYITFGTFPNTTDRYINGLSRTEYSALPNKQQTGFPNQYWFYKAISPTITFYFVPDTNGPYVAKYYSVRQTQDVQIADGDTVEIPYRLLAAYTAGVAWKLAEMYAPSMKAELFGEYQRLLTQALAQDTENVSMMIVPGLTGYWR